MRINLENWQGTQWKKKIDLELQLFSTGIYKSKEKDSLVNILK